MKKTIWIFFAAALLAPAALRAVSPEDYYNAGLDLLMKQHDYDKAVQYFRAAVDQRPDYWQAYQGLGEAYLQASNRTEALVAMRESLRLHPNNPLLRKFMEKVQRDGPWTADRPWRDALSLLSLAVSLFTLGWVLYWTKRLRRQDGFPPRT